MTERKKLTYRKREGRPTHDEPDAPSVPVTVKIPQHIYDALEMICETKRIHKHAAYREAIAEWVERRLPPGMEISEPNRNL